MAFPSTSENVITIRWSCYYVLRTKTKLSNLESDENRHMHPCPRPRAYYRVCNALWNPNEKQTLVSGGFRLEKSKRTMKMHKKITFCAYLSIYFVSLSNYLLFKN